MNALLLALIVAISHWVPAEMRVTEDLEERIEGLRDARLKSKFLAEFCGRLAVEGDIDGASTMLPKITSSFDRRFAAETIARMQVAKGNVGSAVETLTTTFRGLDPREQGSLSLVKMMTSAGLYSEAMTLAKESNVVPPIECVAGSGDLFGAVERLRQSGGLASLWLIDAGCGLARKQGLQSVATLFREYDATKLELRLALVALALGEDGDFDSADEVLKSGMLGHYTTATQNLLHRMNPLITGPDWVERDVRREQCLMTLLPGRFRANEWTLIEHARLDCLRGFRSNSLELCRKANRLIPAITKDVRPREIDSFNDETHRLRRALTVEFARSGSFSEAARVVAGIRETCHYDKFLDVFGDIGAVAGKSVGIPVSRWDEGMLQDENADVAFSLGQRSQTRARLGRWTSFNMGEALIKLHDGTRTRISSQLLQSTEIELAALSQAPSVLEELMAKLIDDGSAEDLSWLLWYAPDEFHPEASLVRCMKMNDPALCILAASRLANGTSTGNAEVIERLTALAASETPDIRYAALSVLCQLWKGPRPLHGLVSHDDDDVEIRTMLAVLKGSITHEVVDETLECPNSWLQGLVAELAATNSPVDVQDAASVDRILNSPNQYAVLRCAEVLLKSESRNDSVTNALRVILQTPQSEEIRRQAEHLIAK